MFKPVSPNVNFPELEQNVLEYWKKNKIFEKSIAKDAPKGNWTFLDGPPFITGLPHYGSLLSSIPKDLFPRYKTMQGYRVRRVWGWDCHGLPVENKVENELGIKRKKDIEEKVGVKKFIDECKRYVQNVSSEWEWYVDHVGRWVDFKNAYKTMDVPYMETVMWVFKQMYDKGFIYKGLRVLLYCPHCATPISNFEVAMDADNYKMLKDVSTTYKYPLEKEKDTYILAWSTTPWNKIVTNALAVNPKLTYVKVKQGNEYYILAKARLEMLKKEPTYEIVEEFKGTKLVGKKFVPHYAYYTIKKGKKAFEVVSGDFATAQKGTGVVTLAAYGEEDLRAMQENNIHVELHLDEEGIIKPDVPKFGGLYYLKSNKLVNEDLVKRGLIYHDENVPHSAPTCWRCGTRLYQAPQDAWYVDVQKLKPKMKETNEKVNWYPTHFKYGRFLKSLENAPDWNISRNRYWGSPVPVWECVCGEYFVPGSIKELEERTGAKITDLHKPEIDEVVITCEKCGKKVKRVPEVLDSWIEAGSAAFAERHFPFEKVKLEEFFPPDFITEYTGQIRAWFYVLHVIAAVLYKSEAFKNVHVSGVILGTDGRKMSKNYSNYPDPKEMLQKYGGDALRLYLMGSPVMHGEDILISEEQYRLQVRGTLLILWNVYNFFISNALVDKWIPEKVSNQQLGMSSKQVLDQWILSLLHRLIENVTDDLEKYDTVSVIQKVNSFVDDLSTWYIRRSRNRVGPTADNQKDKEAFYATCFTVLTTLCRVIAPLIPFIAEAMYSNLTDKESVHLSSWPKVNKKLITSQLEEEMQLVRKVVELVHAQRKEAQIKLRQPLPSVVAVTPIMLSEAVKKLIEEEVNVEEFINNIGDKITVALNKEITPELKAKGEAREIVRMIQEERKRLGTRLDEKVDVVLEDWPKEHENYIKKIALINTIIKGNKFQVTRR